MGRTLLSVALLQSLLAVFVDLNRCKRARVAHPTLEVDEHCPRRFYRGTDKSVCPTCAPLGAALQVQAGRHAWCIGLYFCLLPFPFCLRTYRSIFAGLGISCISS